MKRPKLSRATPDTEKLWGAIRRHRRFTLDDLVAVTELGERFIKGRLYDWGRHGIVFHDNDGYRLGRDLGPLPPYGHGRADMIDRNTGDVLPVIVPDPLPIGTGRSHEWTAKGMIPLVVVPVPKKVPLTGAALKERQKEYARRSRDKQKAARLAYGKKRKRTPGTPLADMTPEEKKAHAAALRHKRYLASKRKKS